MESTTRFVVAKVVETWRFVAIRNAKAHYDGYLSTFVRLTL
jgi:hypothetical protein